MKRTAHAVFALAILSSPLLFAQQGRQAVPPLTYRPEGVTAEDMPYDAGGVVLLRWKAKPLEAATTTQYKVVAAESKDGPWEEIASVDPNKPDPGEDSIPSWAWKKTSQEHAYPVDVSKVIKLKKHAAPPRDSGAAEALRARQEEESLREERETRLVREPVYLKVVMVADGAQAESPVVSAVGRANWFNMKRLANLVLAIILFAVFLWYLRRARRKNLFVRRVDGLDEAAKAVEDSAKGGKPVYYSAGTGPVNYMATIASVSVLGEVARKAAECGAVLKVPHQDPVVMSVCGEVARNAYESAGQSGTRGEEANFFVTQDQFAYVASVDGMIARERPGACFYMGYFGAESLLLAEVGASVGAAQFAGTDKEQQLPFFYAACDYTLIGEELYAAAASLSRNPLLAATLRAQDAGKIIAIAAVFAGAVACTLSVLSGWKLF